MDDDVADLKVTKIKTVDREDERQRAMETGC
jgi:hypothetical protein